MIILLDLNYTLVGNSTEKRSPFIRQIEHEVYRQWLVDLVKPYHVILMTARPAQYYEPTLDSIREKTGWMPQQAFFNEYNLPPPAAKSRMMKDYVFKDHGDDPKNFFGIESNPKTRSMYANLGIASAKIENNEVWDKLPLE